MKDIFGRLEFPWSCKLETTIDRCRPQAVAQPPLNLDTFTQQIFHMRVFHTKRPMSSVELICLPNHSNPKFLQYLFVSTHHTLTNGNERCHL